MLTEDRGRQASASRAAGSWHRATTIDLGADRWQPRILRRTRHRRPGRPRDRGRHQALARGRDLARRSRSPGSGGGAVEALGIGFDGRSRRALPGLRRALERGRPARQHGRELRRRRPLRDRRVPAASSALIPRWGFRAPRRRDLLPDPVAALDRRLRGAGRQPRDQLLPPRPAPEPWSVRLVAAPPDEPARPARRRRASCELRFFAGPRPADVLRRFTDRDRPPAEARGALGARPVGAGGRLERRAARADRRAAGGRRAGLGRPDLPPLPAVRRPARRTRGRAGAHGGDPRPRARGDHLLQPDGLHRATTPSTRRRPASQGLLEHRGRRRLHLQLHRIDALPGRPVRLHHRGRPGGVRARWSTRRSTTATTAGWRTSASTRRSTRCRRRRRRAPRFTTAYPRRLPLRRRRRGAPTRPADRPLPALRLDRRRAAARTSSGAATRPPAGASTASPRRCARRSASGSRGSGSGARTSAATSRSAPTTSSTTSCSRAGSSSARSRA